MEEIGGSQGSNDQPELFNDASIEALIESEQQKEALQRDADTIYAAITNVFDKAISADQRQSNETRAKHVLPSGGMPGSFDFLHFRLDLIPPDNHDGFYHPRKMVYIPEGVFEAMNDPSESRLLAVVIDLDEKNNPVNEVLVMNNGFAKRTEETRIITVDGHLFQVQNVASVDEITPEMFKEVMSYYEPRTQSDDIFQPKKSEEDSDEAA